MSKVGDGKAVSAALNAELIAGTDGTNYQVIATDTAGRLLVGGTGASDIGKAEDAAHTSGDVGVMVLGVRNDQVSNILTGANGDYSTIAVDSRGVQFSALAGSAVTDGATTTVIGPALANSGTAGQPVAAGGLLFNSTTWDRARNNLDGTALASAARTASTPGPTTTNYNGRGVMAYLSVTVASGTGGLTVRFVSNDPTSGLGIYLNTAPTAIVATGIYGYELYPGAGTPGAAGTTNVQQRTQAILPRTFYILVSHGDASSYTYSVGYSIIL